MNLAVRPVRGAVVTEMKHCPKCGAAFRFQRTLHAHLWKEHLKQGRLPR